MKDDTTGLPQLSHLQVLVLECLGTNKCSGRELRRLLVERGTKKSGPAFYQLMARLEEARFVEGEYSQKIVEGQIIKERHYRVSAEGARAMRSTLDFYGSIARMTPGGGLAHA